jgi:hypothetical protein
VAWERRLRRAQNTAFIFASEHRCGISGRRGFGNSLRLLCLSHPAIVDRGAAAARVEYPNKQGSMPTARIEVRDVVDAQIQYMTDGRPAELVFSLANSF